MQNKRVVVTGLGIISPLGLDVESTWEAAKNGISLNGATLYSKMEPCAVCAKMIINSGIKRVVCQVRYQAGEQSLLEAAGIKVEILNEETERY